MVKTICAIGHQCPTAQPGDTITVTATATDFAGNTFIESRSIMVTSNGVVAGQVLDDATGLPIQGAVVQIPGQSNGSATTDQNGRYSLPATGEVWEAPLFVAVLGSQQLHLCRGSA